MIDPYGVFIDRLIIIAFDRRSLTLHTSRRHCKILVVVRTLFEQNGLLIGPGSLVIDHTRQRRKTPISEIAIKKDVISFQRRHRQGEIGHDIIGLGVRVIYIGIAHNIASMLRTVIEIIFGGTGFVGIKHHIEHRRVTLYAFHPHTGKVCRDSLKPPVLVARRKDKRP